MTNNYMNKISYISFSLVQNNVQLGGGLLSTN